MNTTHQCCRGCWQRIRACAGHGREPRWFSRAFSLTLALSRWEREKPLDTGLKSVSHRAGDRFGFTKKAKTDKSAKMEKGPGRRIVFLEMP